MLCYHIVRNLPHFFYSHKVVLVINSKSIPPSAVLTLLVILSISDQTSPLSPRPVRHGVRLQERPHHWLRPHGGQDQGRWASPSLHLPAGRHPQQRQVRLQVQAEDVERPEPRENDQGGGDQPGRRRGRDSAGSAIQGGGEAEDHRAG